MGNTVYILFFIFIGMIVFSFCSVVYYLNRVTDQVEKMISECSKNKEEDQDDQEDRK